MLSLQIYMFCKLSYLLEVVVHHSSQGQDHDQHQSLCLCLRDNRRPYLVDLHLPS